MIHGAGNASAGEISLDLLKFYLISCYPPFDGCFTRAIDGIASVLCCSRGFKSGLLIILRGFSGCYALSI